MAFMFTFLFKMLLRCGAQKKKLTKVYNAKRYITFINPLDLQFSRGSRDSHESTESVNMEN